MKAWIGSAARKATHHCLPHSSDDTLIRCNMTAKKQFRHGLRQHPLYTRWLMMWQRCTNPNQPRYKDYGGKGIFVCDRWKNFANFLNDMGEAPPETTIERIDNLKGYTPENCIWATRKVQMRNTSRTRLIEFNGKTQCVLDWAKEIGLEESSLRERLAKWTVEKSLTTPKRKIKHG